MLADDQGTGEGPSLAGDQEPRQAGQRLCASITATGTGHVHTVTEADGGGATITGPWAPPGTGEGGTVATSYLSSSDGQEDARDRQHVTAVHAGHVTLLGQEQKAAWILITERTQIGHGTLFQKGHFQAFVLQVSKKKPSKISVSVPWDVSRLGQKKGPVPAGPVAQSIPTSLRSTGPKILTSLEEILRSKCDA